MRKLNGITINGEYLGNSVVINGMFRAICTISPVIMRDFVLIINKIDRLEDAVKIHNFNCGFDCIDIEFENKTSKGMASLYFKLHDGEPLLKDCKLVIDNEEYSTFQEKIKLRSKKDMTNPNKTAQGTQNSELDRLQKIRELREKKQAMQRQQAGGMGPAGQRMGPAGMPQNPPGAPNRVNPANLSPEQQRDAKRQELMEKKRRLMEAKKAKMGGAGSALSEEEHYDEDGLIQEAEGNAAGASSASSASSVTDAKTKKPKPAPKPMGIVAQEDGTITNELGQPVEKQERVNPDGTISEVYVNPENPDEVYEQNENGEFVSNNVVQDDSYATDEYSLEEEYGDLGGGSALENLSDEDLENMSDEELAALEAELNAELGDDTGYGDYNDYSAGSAGYPSQGFNMDGFAQELAQGLTQGLTQGLSQGLAQGLAQGFGLAGQGGGGFGGGAGFGQGPGDNGGFGGGFGQGFSDNSGFGAGQGFTSPQIQQVSPDYAQIDSLNSTASNSAKDAYAYDENSNLDDISDFYSDFYDDVQAAIEESERAAEAEAEAAKQAAQAKQDGAPTTEIDALKAELEALRAQAGEQKELMSVEEFMAKQQELKEAKEKLSRQKMKIVGSNVRVNASALDGGVFAAGKKLYKWGDTRILDE